MPNSDVFPLTQHIRSAETPALCPICSGDRHERFRARVLNKHEVRYFFCDRCGLLQTENPYWLEEAYSSAIAASDTGLVARNLEIADRLSSLIYFCFDASGRYIDLAGGYGLLTRLMRDRGFDFYWDDRYCENLFARGFEADTLGGAENICAVTAFEVLEHVPDPLAFIRSAFERAKASTFIFSTVLYADQPPRPADWWYYALDTGQHISFFRTDTLSKLAEKLNCRLYTNGSLHAITDKIISPLAFRLYTSRASRLLAMYAAGRMRDKTTTDSEFVKRQLPPYS